MEGKGKLWWDVHRRIIPNCGVCASHCCCHWLFGMPRGSPGPIYHPVDFLPTVCVCKVAYQWGAAEDYHWGNGKSSN